MKGSAVKFIRYPEKKLPSQILALLRFTFETFVYSQITITCYYILLLDILTWTDVKSKIVDTLW